jgi:hypothetical protein
MLTLYIQMTRALQDRLALANVKIKNGWENMSLDAIEPQVEERMKKKRPASSVDTISDTASTTSSRLHSSSGFGSSPLTGPMFSDDLRSGGSVKRLRSMNHLNKFASSGAATGRRNRFSARNQQTWKKDNDLPESSPIKHTKHAHFATNNIHSLSFISETTTVPDEPPSPEFSEDDDADLPVHSFRFNPHSRIASSPPRTPPPERRLQRQNISWSRTPKTNVEGADLLVYLANSPSAGNSRTIKPAMTQAPSTPPRKSTPLPSSHMTPGTSGSAFFGFGGPTTPNTNFNFSDFVNVTPSPAQPQWTRTPVAGRTPGTATRRRLNFDFLPPTSSPSITRHKNDGLGMELGGELR